VKKMPRQILFAGGFCIIIGIIGIPTRRIEK